MPLTMVHALATPSAYLFRREPPTPVMGGGERPGLSTPGRTTQIFLNQNHLRREGATGCCRTGVGSAGGGLGRASAELTGPVVAPKRGWVRRCF